MRFTTYCEFLKKEDGMLKLFSEKLGIVQTKLWMWRKGKIAIPIWEYRNIERITKGSVTIGELVDEQSELLKHKDRGALSKQVKPKPRELPHLMGGDGPGGEGMSLQADREATLPCLPTASAWDTQRDGRESVLPTSDVAGQKNQPPLSKGLARIMDGVRKASQPGVGSVPAATKAKEKDI